MKTTIKPGTLLKTLASLTVWDTQNKWIELSEGSIVLFLDTERVSNKLASGSWYMWCLFDDKKINFRFLDGENKKEQLKIIREYFKEIEL
jgi:hypothetical protein